MDEIQEQRDSAVEELVELSRILDELLERNGSNGGASDMPEQETTRAT